MDLLDPLDSIPPALDVLIHGTPGKLLTHEIILVHGFKVSFDDQKRLSKFRNVLEQWIISATETVRDRVNVRTFAFDGAHVLYNGHNGISDAIIEFAKQLAVTSVDLDSPLFCRTVKKGIDRERERNRASRSVVFIAHGLGIWVVKELLVLYRNSENCYNPTGLIFLDVPELTSNTTPIDMQTESAISQYLYELAEIYKIQAMPFKIRELQSTLLLTDASFKLLSDSRYGKCETLKGNEGDRDIFIMKMWCDSIWMSSNPRLKIESSVIKTLKRGVHNMIHFDKTTELAEQVKKLEAMKLTESIQEAISSQGFRDVNPDDELVDSEPIIDLYASSGRSRYSPGNGKGKQKATSPSTSPRRHGFLTPSSSMTPLPKIPEENELENHPEDAFGSCSKIDEKCHTEDFYDFDDAMAQINAAAKSNDQEAIIAAQSRLQLVKWHQCEELGKDHPKVFITQREIISTNLAHGMRNGKPTEDWTRDEFCDLHDEMRQTFEGLEESIGTHHRETIESLAMLFCVRVLLVKNKIFPWAAVVSLREMLNDRLDERSKTPEEISHSLHIKYRAGITLAQISEHGDFMLADLLREVEDHLLTAASNHVVELLTLRSNILKKIPEMRVLRDEDHAAYEVEMAEEKQK
ncbi:hypothetical protein F5Y11DRAFT_363591 [Daldinia sp. FL1419]|nr:hypothetical protein F5Y11DRAFT_363591 [Daldinia sp. FL1419]